MSQLDTTEAAVPVSAGAAASRSRDAERPLLLRLPGLVFSFFASYGFATVLFLLLLLLTFLGTMEQVELGLFETQKKYFNSFFLVHEFFDTVPVLLPGVSLLLVLLSLNIIAGGIIRIRKRKTTVGVLISHFGILFMLFGGLVTYAMAEEGHLTLFENQRSDLFQSYYDWEIAISKVAAPGGTVKEYIISGDRFQDEDTGESRQFFMKDLPFDVRVENFARNSQVMPKGPMFTTPHKVIDGFFLEPRKLETEAEQNVAGAYLVAKDKKSGQEYEGILWGIAEGPLTFMIDGEAWSFDLRKKRTQLPFTVVLDKFEHEFHPGTSRPKLFRSDVTKIENGSEQKLRIEMNQPLRHKGYTLYQSGWGPQNAAPGQPLFSTFSVVRNPADKFPLIACIIVTAGMLIHFGQKLTRYLKAESKRHA